MLPLAVELFPIVKSETPPSLYMEKQGAPSDTALPSFLQQNHRRAMPHLAGTFRPNSRSLFSIISLHFHTGSYRLLLPASTSSTTGETDFS